MSWGRGGWFSSTRRNNVPRRYILNYSLPLLTNPSRVFRKEEFGLNLLNPLNNETVITALIANGSKMSQSLRVGAGRGW